MAQNNNNYLKCVRTYEDSGNYLNNSLQTIIPQFWVLCHIGYFGVGSYVLTPQKSQRTGKVRIFLARWHHRLIFNNGNHVESEMLK